VLLFVWGSGRLHWHCCFWTAEQNMLITPHTHRHQRGGLGKSSKVNFPIIRVVRFTALTTRAYSYTILCRVCVHVIIRPYHLPPFFVFPGQLKLCPPTPDPRPVSARSTVSNSDTLAEAFIDRRKRKDIYGT
jgi:hypothetical protein